MVALLVSIGYIAYLVLLMPSITSESARMDPWWTPPTVIAVFGLGVLPGVLSFSSDTRPMRVSAAAAALAFLLAAAVWPFAWNGPDLPAGDAFWLAAFPGVASLAAIVAWPIWAAFVYMVVGCTSVMVITAVARGGISTGMLLTDVAFAIMFCTLFVGGAAMAIRTGRLLDSTTAMTHQAAASAAAQHAQTVESERFDALVHDGVLASLLAASRGQPLSVVGPLARATLAELDELKTPPMLHQLFSTDEAITYLRSASADADDQAAFDVQHSNAVGDEKLPADGVRAVGSALSEALRNSRLHAGSDAWRKVTVDLSDALLRVDVTDNGAGFDPRTVAPHRLGIAVSIVGRMGSLTGGFASVHSGPGSGTRVHLEWQIR
ncbi:sensor histidine kinase [Williamsia limnetica]|nr:ATP-binding protein [Williamsia limnetica]